METYYSKQEYNKMKSSLTKTIKELEKENAKLREQNKQLKIDYDVLLETSAEHVTEF